MPAIVERIVAGGQTGVDRAALDSAVLLGIPAGGWCPRGRRAEDGPIPPHYPLKETDAAGYRPRTRRNVDDSDGTMILAWGAPAGGTRFTAEYAAHQGRPHAIVDLAQWSDADVQRVRAWLAAHDIRTLNVAGPRASQAPDAYDAARAFMTALLG
jgi:hypothetical protein